MVCYRQFRLHDRADNLHAHILSVISLAHACPLPSAYYIYISDNTKQHKPRGTTQYMKLTHHCIRVNTNVTKNMKFNTAVESVSPDRS